MTCGRRLAEWTKGRHVAPAFFPAVGYLGVWGKLVAGLGPLAPVRPCEKALRDLRRRIGAGARCR